MCNKNIDEVRYNLEYAPDKCKYQIICEAAVEGVSLTFDFVLEHVMSKEM